MLPQVLPLAALQLGTGKSRAVAEVGRERGGEVIEKGRKRRETDEKREGEREESER